MDEQEILYTMALTRIGFFNIAQALLIYKELGSGKAIYENRNDIRGVLPGCSCTLVKALGDWGEPLRRAEAEMEFILRNNILALPFNDSRYPQRLKECDDAPIILYFKGSCNLNAKRMINIVGTRQCTAYGEDLIRQFVGKLKKYCPDTVIVSGLAYGVDICAHRRALEDGLDTIGVLAHGLDYLYPTRHKETAAKMLQQGGLLTEFMSDTNADKANFVRRNRIVAGIADATILVESAEHGGGLITADIAQSYHRDVFAFPGNANAPYSAGCNNLIRDNKAALISNAKDFVKAMGWQDEMLLKKKLDRGIERTLFPELNEEEERIVKLLQSNNDLQMNIIAVKTGIPIHKVTSLLFQLEMKGVIKSYAGGMYHLLA